MRVALRTLAAFTLAITTLSAWSLANPLHMTAEDHTVTIVDTSSPPYRPISPETGTWGYAPSHIDVVKGEKITFVNPSTNTQAHTVTSLEFKSVNGNATNVIA